MPVLAHDETIRVPKLPIDSLPPVRRVPQQFAPTPARSWPRLLVLAFISALAAGAVAYAEPVDFADHASRAARGDELLRSLGR